jgi:hypothetical protein
MRTGLGADEDRRMSDGRSSDRDGVRARIVIELSPGSDPIQGSVSSEVDDKGFSGWMELIDALERARRAAGPSPSRDSGAGETGG